MAVVSINQSVRIIFLICLVILFSCEEQGIFIVCNDCTEDEPLTANLEIKLDENTNSTVLIEIYEGNLEDNNLIFSAETASLIFYHQVKVNRKYTVTATYNIQPAVYIAVDSALPRVKYSKEQCDNPCYWVYDRILNLRLK